MGLDGVDLVLAVEDEFGIYIPDNTASKMRTLGDLWQYILAQLELRSISTNGQCPSAWMFRKLRGELVGGFGLRRDAVRPASVIGELIPAGPARRRWPDVAVRVGLHAPRFRFLAPVTSQFPDPALTLRQVLTEYSTDVCIKPNARVDEEAAWSKVRAIVAKQLRVEESTLSRHTRFVEDLHF